jgi:hypothetical protein
MQTEAKILPKRKQLTNYQIFRSISPTFAKIRQNCPLPAKPIILTGLCAILIRRPWDFNVFTSATSGKTLSNSVCLMQQ